jgi:putative transposase
MSALVAEKYVAEATGLSQKAVRLRAVQEDWPVIRKQKQGGAETLYLRQQTPIDVREKLVVHDAVTGAAGNDVAIHDNVPAKSKKIGKAKYNLAHAYRAAKEKASWGEKTRAAEDFLLAYNAGVLLPQIYNRLGEIQIKTLEALDKRLREHDDNYLCLCDGRGGWRKHGTTKYKGRQVSEATKAVLLQCYLHGSRPSVKMAIRAARATLEKNGEPVLVSDSTLRRWLRDYEKHNAGPVCLARDGMKVYIDRFGSYITRDASTLKVGQCLVADGKTLNFFILHPETGRPCRMTLIVYFDWASRYPCGWQILPTENQIGILAAFRNAVQALGRYPDSAYLDNGRAFKSRLFTNAGQDMDFEEMAGLYARVGTAPMFAKPYNGRSKVVERFFETLQSQLEFMMPSYCGDSIQTKPPWMHRNETYQQALHEARTHNWIPSIREAALIIAAYFKWYADQPHQGLGDKTPAEVFLPNRGPGVDPRQLAYDFMWRKAPVYARRCRITLWGIEYESDALQNLSPKLPLQARIDTADMSQIYVYTQEGVFLGEAWPVQACHPLARLFGDQVSMDQVAAENKRQNRQIRNTKKHLTSLGISEESQHALDILPFNTKVPVIADAGRDALEADAPAHELPESDVRRLEQVARLAEQQENAVPDADDDRLARIAEAAKQQAETLPEIPRPKFWGSDLEHYEWCFSLVHKHGRTPEPADQAFMTEFESLPEFEHYQQRFEDLKLIYQ